MFFVQSRHIGHDAAKQGDFSRPLIQYFGFRKQRAAMATREGQRLYKAARQGDPQAQLALGRLYLKGGEGLGRNPASALEWLLRAWKAGAAEAAVAIVEQLPPPPQHRTGPPRTR